jgi:hypothetical protein
MAPLTESVWQIYSVAALDNTEDRICQKVTKEDAVEQN